MNERRRKKKGTKRSRKVRKGKEFFENKERKVSNLQLLPSMLQNLLSVLIVARISAKPETKFKSSKEKFTTVITTSGTWREANNRNDDSIEDKIFSYWLWYTCK